MKLANSSRRIGIFPPLKPVPLIGVGETAIGVLEARAQAPAV